ncbi:hypothetical protein D9611_014777 [Ephemerocybe angulata]|uniref:Uncharacterized protein n=1 Tax=Ephemerocybe angulata TaxID=980116 RepID=A0A8H5CAF5_9AGAR|nr:hypothetical protein D9611_014777 [Tulosesus angulatus]
MASLVHAYEQTRNVNVRLMWPTPLSVAKVLFFAARYYVLVFHLRNARDLSFNYSFLPVLRYSARKCAMNTRLTASKAIHAPSVGILITFLLSVKCYKYIGINFSLALLSVVTIMVIMVYIAHRKYRRLNSNLLKLFYRDGILYFLCLSGLATANIVASFVASASYKFLLLETQVLLHSVLSTRMLLHLRKWAEHDIKGGRTVETSLGEIEFVVRLRNARGAMSTLPSETLADATFNRYDSAALL